MYKFILCSLVSLSAVNCWSALNKSSFHKYKNDLRNKIIKNSNTIFEDAPLKQVEHLVDTPEPIYNIFKIEEMGLLEGQIDIKPWSDDYWPIAKGVLGARYADPEFGQNDGWENTFNYVVKRTARNIFSTNIELDIDQLSPSEKYDLLISTDRSDLTDAMWKQGKQYFDRYGSVETWMGICHGWAPASYMLDRPENAIEVLAADGKTKIRFYPSDIKALSSLLWAGTNPPVKFIGGRCNDKKPEIDANGRVISRDCRDIHPGVWHLSVVNQLGISKRSMVIDATYSYEVWNQPMISYNYFYFNPVTMEKTEVLKEALVDLKKYKNDPFKAFRSSKTTQVIGIYMSIEYGVESHPKQRLTDDPRYDRSTRTEYKYDLELDDNGGIVGGEWHSTNHPDFLWTPTRDARALTDFDYYLLGNDLWNGASSLNDNVTGLAASAARNGLPLATIIESLINLSNKEQPSGEL